MGGLPDADVDDNATCDAAELVAGGNIEGARELLMNVLSKDLRCIEAHAHLGNLEFDDSPDRALMHYDVGIRIGELSLPQDFKGMLQWGALYNRPFLRCLHGHTLCLWKLGRPLEAEKGIERISSLNPTNNQGVRFCLEDLRKGLTWRDAKEQEPSSARADGNTIH